MSEKRPCIVCGGDGKVRCPACDGKGWRSDISGGEEVQNKCTLCWGSGKANCPECNGRGYII